MSKDKTSFEAQLSKLNEIVNALEVGELSLDDSLKQYEAGIKLVRTCQEKLNNAQQQIEILKDKGVEPFDVDDSA
ncbi:MAG: exodeoxyribonuclease VII small subunit [Gammaproteobacteria bacterium]|nr:exodeoxyribonuclease VII small subunit [Gammaproteobacteria bacterium]